MSVLRPVGATPCHRANPSVHVSRNQRRSGVTSRSTPRNASWAWSSTLSRRAAVNNTKGCAARNAFEITGIFDRLVPGRNATTLSAKSFCAHNERSGGRYGTRARFGAAAGSVDILLQKSVSYSNWRPAAVSAGGTLDLAPNPRGSDILAQLLRGLRGLQVQVPLDVEGIWCQKKRHLRCGLLAVAGRQAGIN